MITYIKFLFGVFMFLQIHTAFSQQSLKSKIIRDNPTFINLYGYNGVIEDCLGSATANKEGDFTINLINEYEGMAYFKINTKNTKLFYLSKNTKIDSITDNFFFNSSDSINTCYSNFRANDFLYNNSISVLNQMLEIYRMNSNMFNLKFVTSAENEIERLTALVNHNELVIKKYPKIYNIYKVRQYIKNISDLNIKLRVLYADLLAFPEKELKEIDIISSGLTKPLVRSYYNLCSVSKDKSKTKLQEFIKILLEKANAIDNQHQKEIIVSYLLLMLENYNLSEHNEYLSKLIRSKNCTVNKDAEKIMKFYSEIKVNQQAPQIYLKNNKADKAKNNYLSDYPEKHKLLIFGDSNCPKCKYDLKILLDARKQFKSLNDFLILYVDLGNEKLNQPIKEEKFIYYRDNKNWNGEIVKNFYVYAAPTYIVVDENNNIEKIPILITEFISEYSN